MTPCQGTDKPLRQQYTVLPAHVHEQPGRRTLRSIALGSFSCPRTRRSLMSANCTSISLPPLGRSGTPAESFSEAVRMSTMTVLPAGWKGLPWNESPVACTGDSGGQPALEQLANGMHWKRGQSACRGAGKQWMHWEKRLSNGRSMLCVLVEAKEVKLL